MARGAGGGGEAIILNIPSKVGGGAIIRGTVIIRGNTVYRPEIFRSTFTDLTDHNHHTHTLCPGKTSNSSV